MEGIWESRDFWDEVCRYNKERGNGGASSASKDTLTAGDEETGSEEETESESEDDGEESGSDGNGSEEDDEKTESETD